LLGLPSLVLKTLSSWKIYILIATAAFSIGAYTSYKVTSYFDDIEKAKAIQRIIDAEQTAIDLQNKREVIYKDRIKEIVKYVKTRDNIECLNDVDLELFNKRY
jgi:hypothetical protein